MDDKLVRLSDVLAAATTPEKCDGYNLYPPSHGELLEQISNIPAVDAVEVIHGRWLDPNGRQTDQERFNWHCSECGHIQHVPVQRGWKEFTVTNKFCAYCGARMDGEEEHNEAD